MGKRQVPLILKGLAAVWLSFAAQSTLSAAVPTPWWNTRVDTVGNLAWDSSLALDAEGNPHIAYHDVGNGDLKYASKSGGSWTVETVEPTGQTGSFASLAIDAKGNPQIAYYDSTNHDLKFASKSGGSWTVETVDGSSRSCAGWLFVDVGWYASLALNAQGNPRIAYQDTSEIREGEYANDLKYASKDGASWTVETVDGPGYVGSFASLAVDAEDNSSVAYFDSTNHALKFASQSGGNWTVETVAATGSVGWYASLALDAQGNPHIAYYEMTEWMRDGDLKYANKNGGSWVIETVDATGNVGEFAALALDAQGNPRIAYYDGTNHHLKYASKDGASWTVETVDATGNVGLYPSLALDTQGNPRIAYWDEHNQELKYASAAVELNSPGTAWTVGASRTVTWQGTGPVDLFISSDGGTTWTPLASQLAGGSYDLEVPNLPTQSAKLKLERAMPYSVTITSGLFTIAPMP
jgi:hypothetical protein